MAVMSQDRQAAALEECAVYLNRVADALESLLTRMEEKAKPAATVVPAPLKAVVPAVPKMEPPAGK